MPSFVPDLWSRTSSSGLVPAFSSRRLGCEPEVRGRGFPTGRREPVVASQTSRSRPPVGNATTAEPLVRRPTASQLSPRSPPAALRNSAHSNTASASARPPFNSDRVIVNVLHLLSIIASSAVFSFGDDLPATALILAPFAMVKFQVSQAVEHPTVATFEKSIDDPPGRGRQTP